MNCGKNPRSRLMWIIAALFLAACANPRPLEGAVNGLIYQNTDGVQVISHGESTELVNASRLGARGPIILSPDGRYVVYSQSGRDLWLTDVSTMESTVLIKGAVRNSDTEIKSMKWSPDGQQLGILVNTTGPEAIPERQTLFLLDIESRRLVEVESGVTGYTWLPTSNDIAFIKQFGGEPIGLYLMQAGSQRAQILLEGLMEPYVAAALQGDVLAVIMPLPNQAYHTSLFTINLSDGSIHDLLHNARRDHLLYPNTPVWSPQGDELAFLACVPLDNDPSVCSSSIVLVSITTGQVRILANGVQGPIAWSPGSDKIAGIEQEGAHGIIEVATIDGSIDAVSNDRPADYLFEYR